MVESEYKCLRDIDELANSVGNITPIPVACGEYIEDVYFLVCTFLDMEIKLPPPEVFAPLVAKLHRNSSQTEKDCENPGKKFGKHSGFMTFHGNVRVNHKFSDTWEGYFKNSTWNLLHLEQEVRVSYPPYLFPSWSFRHICAANAFSHGIQHDILTSETSLGLH